MRIIYLATTGNDETGDGSRARPVATLARAISLTGTIKESRRRIVAGNGTYLDTSVTLEAADSGLEIVAAKGATPVFYGGTAITEWHKDGGDSPFRVAALSGVREGAWDFRALVVNGRLAERARYPETGCIRHDSEFTVNWMSTTKGGWERKPLETELTTLKVRPGSLPTAMSERNAELTIYHSWDESLVGIQHWDREHGVITFSTPAGHPPGAFGSWKEQARTFVVWNVREGMTRPGQWFLDREAGQLVYWPLPEEQLEDMIAYAPTASTVLRLTGTETAPVQDVLLRGLGFGITTTPLVAGGFGALHFEGAIEGTCAHGLRLENIKVCWSGGQGIRITKSNSIRCSNATIHNVGAGGLVFSGNDGIVKGSLIHHNGRIYPSALALRVAGERWRVHHNTLHHTPYSAVNAGGSHLRFEHNRFHHVMEELLDGAAIYIFAGKNCILRGNFTYDVRDEQVHAYYLDEQSADCLVAGNVATGVPWPIHNHMAWNCVLRNNVCLHSNALRMSFINCNCFRLERNVFACEGEIAFEPSYTGVSLLKNNVCFSKAGQYRWTFHDRLPALERNTTPTPILPRNAGSVMADIGCACKDGRVTYANHALAKQLGLRELDVSNAGCGRE